MKDVYLGLGANVGNRKANIKKAVSLLDQHESVDVIKVSTLIETKPRSRIRHPDFINGAVYLRTILTLQELFELTSEIEKKCGRATKGNDDPRSIDLDILFYGTDILCQDDLTVPHPMLHERDFVLIPLMELCPTFVHPVLGESVSVLYKQVVWGM